ncbi:MAG: Ig-like domain-containing protein [bacterium]
MWSGSPPDVMSNERTGLFAVLGLAVVATLAVLVLTAPGAQAGALAQSGTQPFDVPSNLAAGATPTHLFSLKLASSWDANGDLLIQFPAAWADTASGAVSFAMSGTACAAPGAGTLAAPDFSLPGRILLTRSNDGGACPAGAIATIGFGGLDNPAASGPYVIDMRTRNAGGATIDSATASIVINGAFSSGSISTLPATPVAGAVTTYTFTETGAGTWPANGKMVIQFPNDYTPQPYALAATPTASGGSCVTGTLSAVGANISPTPAGPAVLTVPTITLTRVPGGACTPGQVLSVTVSGVTNPGVAAQPGAFTIRTFTSTGSQRGFVDGTTANLSPALGSAAGAVFTAADVGRLVMGPNIPSGTTIISFTSASSVTMSQSATGAQAAGSVITILDGLVDTNVAGVSPLMTVGTLSGVTITTTPTPAVAGVLSSWEFAWTSANALPMDGRIQFTFPDDVILSGVTTPATVTGCTTGVFPVTITSLHVITVTRATSGTNVPAVCSRGAWTLTLGGIRNPRYGGLQDFGALTSGNIKTMTAGVPEIDYGTGTITINPGVLTATAAWLSDYTAGKNPVTYRLEFTPANLWTTTDELWISGLPTSLGVSGAALIVPASGCLNGVTNGATIFSLVAPGTVKMAARTGGTGCVAGTPLAVEISGVTNQPFSGVAGPFTLRTRTALGADIDVGTAAAITYVAATFSDGPSSVVPIPSTAGSTAAYSIAFTLVNQWPSTGMAKVTFPSQVDLAGMSPSVGTTGATCFSGTFTATRVGTTQVVTIQRSGAASDCAPGSSAILTISGVKNPPVPGNYGLLWETETSTGAAIDATPALTTPPQVGQTASITVAALTGISATPTSVFDGATTTYSIQFKLTNPWPIGGLFKVDFGTTPGTFDLGALGTIATVTGCDGTFAVTHTTTVATITRSGGTACAAGTTVTMTLTGVKNPGVAGVQTFTSPTAFSTWTSATPGPSVKVDQGPAAASPVTVSILPSALTSVSLSPSTPAAGVTSSYTFQFTLANDWPNNGLFTATFPAGYGVVVAGPGSLAATLSGNPCTTGDTFLMDALSTGSGSAGGTALFDRAAGAKCLAGTSLTVTITAGITNPAGPQSSFIPFQTTTSSGGIIDTGGVAITTGPATPVVIGADHLDPGVAATYTFLIGSTSTWPATGSLGISFFEKTPPGPYASPRWVSDSAFVTGGTTTVTSALNLFLDSDVGKPVTGWNVPTGTTVAAVAAGGGSITLSQSTLPFASAGGVTIWAAPPVAIVTGCSGTYYVTSFYYEMLIMRAGDGAPCPPGTITAQLSGIVNPSGTGRTGMIEVRLIAPGVVLEEHFGSVFISQPASDIVSPASTFVGVPGNRSLVLQVKIRDASGNGVAGRTVTWAKTSGAGILGATTSVTDDSGIATAQITTDGPASATAPALTVTASANNAQGAALTNSPIIFKVNPLGVSGNGGPVIARLNVTATPATVSADVGQVTLSAVAFDDLGRSLGDVTSTTTFTVDNGGACATGNVCNGLTKAGVHNVTGNNLGITGKFSLTVTPGVAKKITAHPFTAANNAPGTSQALQAKVSDAFENGVPGVTVTWAVTSGGGSIAPTSGPSSSSGLASATVTTGTTAGANTVTAAAAGLTNSPVTFTVTSATPSALTITPGTFTFGAGGSRPLQATLKDANGKGITGATLTWSATDGSLSAQLSTTDANGQATVTFSSRSIGTATITARSGSLSGTTTATTIAGPLGRLEVTPAGATVGVGVPKTFSVSGFDAFDNPLASAQSGARFDMMPDGTCSGSTCTATAPGTHTVTVFKDGVTGFTLLQVTGEATPTPTPSGSSTTGKGSPGFELVGLLVGLAAVGLLARRKA